MNIFIFCIFFLILAFINIPKGIEIQNNNKLNIINQGMKDEYVKFDSFSNSSSKSIKVKHLENFAFEANRRSMETGYIISYAGMKDNNGESLRNLLKIRNFLIKVKSISSEKLVFLDGGCRKEGTTDFYFVPRGVCPPKPTPTTMCNN